MEAKGIVYKVTNMVNGKIYIGQTTNSLHKRWIAHKSLARCGRKNRDVSVLARAISKYGEESFLVESICCPISLDNLDGLERGFILSIQTLVPEGYNIHPGGRTSRGRKTSEETKLKQSEALKGRTFTETHCRAISEAKKGVPIAYSEEGRKAKREKMLGNSHAKGHRHTEDTRKQMSASTLGKTYALGSRRSEEFKQRMSEDRKGVQAGLKNSNSRGLVYTPFGVFESTTEAALNQSFSRATVADRCRSPLPQWCEYFWERQSK